MSEKDKRKVRGRVRQGKKITYIILEMNLLPMGRETSTKFVKHKSFHSSLLTVCSLMLAPFCKRITNTSAFPF
jgi:hypothetical protein